MSPGSMPSGSREVYQEGLIIPPVRLVHEGEYVEEMLDLILANVRTPASGAGTCGPRSPRTGSPRRESQS